MDKASRPSTNRKLKGIMPVGKIDEPRTKKSKFLESYGKK